MIWNDLPEKNYPTDDNFGVYTDNSGTVEESLLKLSNPFAGGK